MTIMIDRDRPANDPTKSTADRKWRTNALFSACAVLLIASSATAASDWQGNVSIGADYQFNTNLDDSNAEFDFWHTNLSVRAQRPLGDESKWSLTLGGEYRAFGFRFDGLGGGLDPWDTIHIVRVAPRLAYQIDQHWSLFGGPIGEFSGESGSDAGDAMRGGALFGAMWRPNKRLMIGLGVLGISEIEEDFLIQPVVLLDWQVTDAFRITTQSWSSRGGLLELIYRIGEGWEVSLAGGRERERFRLDTKGTGTGISRGVGEENSLPISLSVSKTLRDGMKITVFGGVALNGELRVETATGNNVAVSDYDKAIFAGASLSLPF